MVNRTTPRPMKTNFRNRVAKALRIRICLFLLALVGTTLAVSRKQVCGQTPFNKVSLKKKELVNPRAASGFSSHAGFLGDAQHRDVDYGEYVGEYLVIQVKYWFSDDDSVTPERRWGLPPRSRDVAEYFSNEGWETIRESNYVGYDPGLLVSPISPGAIPKGSRGNGLLSWQETLYGYWNILEYLHGQYSWGDRSLTWLARNEWSAPVPSFVWEWHENFIHLAPWLRHTAVRQIRVAVYRDSSGRIREREGVIFGL